MTKELSTERAIEALYTVRAYYASLTAGYPKGKDCKGIGDVMCSEIANSCLMAIKALEQLCEDCISREEATSRIEVRRKITCESDPYNYEEWTKGYEEGIDDAIAMINSVPSVTPKQRWIPVSERLPKIHEDVLLSLRSLDVVVGFRAETEPYFYCHGAYGDYIKPQNVLAWMPLPQPYKAESEEEK